MEGFLLLGFLIGMQHALEADHVAAIGTMLSNGKLSARRMAARGAAWGFGHTVTLFAICGAAITLGLTLSSRAEAALEMCVGVMLALLGLDVLRRMRKRRVHFHAHRHTDGRAHVHAHSHEGATQPHTADPHEHEHPQGLPMRALAVGLVHGAAGSAGLLALSVAATRDPLVALGYVALFGIGSILGMAALSFAATLPLARVESRVRGAHAAVCIGAALLAVGLGAAVIYESAPAAFAAS